MFKSFVSINILGAVIASLILDNFLFNFAMIRQLRQTCDLMRITECPFLQHQSNVHRRSSVGAHRPDLTMHDGRLSQS
jgi:hypothetical protein